MQEDANARDRCCTACLTDAPHKHAVQIVKLQLAPHGANPKPEQKIILI